MSMQHFQKDRFTIVIIYFSLLISPHYRLNTFLFILTNALWIMIYFHLGLWENKLFLIWPSVSSMNCSLCFFQVVLFSNSGCFLTFIHWWIFSWNSRCNFCIYAVLFYSVFVPMNHSLGLANSQLHHLNWRLDHS